jgi:hypothetical protein
MREKRAFSLDRKRALIAWYLSEVAKTRMNTGENAIPGERRQEPALG